MAQDAVSNVEEPQQFSSPTSGQPEQIIKALAPDPIVVASQEQLTTARNYFLKFKPKERHKKGVSIPLPTTDRGKKNPYRLRYPSIRIDTAERKYRHHKKQDGLGTMCWIEKEDAKFELTDAYLQSLQTPARVRHQLYGPSLLGTDQARRDIPVVLSHAQKQLSKTRASDLYLESDHTALCHEVMICGIFFKLRLIYYRYETRPQLLYRAHKNFNIKLERVRHTEEKAREALVQKKKQDQDALLHSQTKAREAEEAAHAEHQAQRAGCDEDPSSGYGRMHCMSWLPLSRGSAAVGENQEDFRSL